MARVKRPGRPSRCADAPVSSRGGRHDFAGAPGDDPAGEAGGIYKHVRDHGALLQAVVIDAAGELADVLADAAGGSDEPPEARLGALADAYRAFAHRSPRASALLFADLGPGMAAPLEVSALAARPVLDVAASLVGPEEALSAARVLTAFVHGFTTMELGGAFRLGGSVDEAFRLGVRSLARGLTTAA